jgi:ABC-type antimicrobial peptide transport system permease subunit
MNSGDIFGLGARNLLRRKTRTLLAVMGVIIGVSAIIVMLSIGYGLQKSFADMIESWGNLHLVTVYKGASGSGGITATGDGSYNGNKKLKLDNKAIEKIEKLEYVTAVSPVETAYVTIKLKKLVTEVSVIGIRPEVIEKFNYKIEKGRLLQAGDKNCIVFGNRIPLQFYDPKKTSYYGGSNKAPEDVLTDKIIVTAEPVGYGKNLDESKKIVYEEYKFKGVGVLENPEDYETAYNVFMPIEIARKINEDRAKAEKQRYDKNAGYDSAYVYVDDITKVKEVSKQIRDEMGFQTNSLGDSLDKMQEQTKMIQAVLGGIGAISLLVAALGITNTMVMSIYERTKEIGVMKVIGADLPDIRKLFLIEAALIGLVGGVLGIGFSYLASMVVNVFASAAFGAALGVSTSTISIIPMWLLPAALGFSTGIGLLAGYSPARRAMRLSALESLRNE